MLKNVIWNFRMFNKENTNHMVLVKYYLRENDYPNSLLKSIKKLLFRRIAKRCGLILTDTPLSEIISKIEKSYNAEEYSLRALCEVLYPSIYKRTVDSEWNKEQLKYAIYCEYSDLVINNKVTE